MTRHLIPFIATCLLLTYNPTQGQVSKDCDLIASRLAKKLTYPMINRENNIENKLIVWYYSDTDTLQIRFLKKAKFEGVNKMVDKFLRTQEVTPPCDCIFNIDFDIVYLDSTKTITYDTLLVSADSLAYILSSHQNATYNATVEEGRELFTKLQSLKKSYDFDYIPAINAQTESPLPKIHKFKSLKSSKDSITIRIWKVSDFMGGIISIYQLGLDSKGKWYAKKKANPWQNLDIEENELRQTIVPSLIKLPSPPTYPYRVSDGWYYDIEVWTNKNYRHYTIHDPELIAKHYGFWIDKEFVTIMDKLTSR